MQKNSIPQSLFAALALSLVSTGGTANPLLDVSAMVKDTSDHLKTGNSITANDDCEDLSGDWVGTCEDQSLKTTPTQLKITQYGCRGFLKNLTDEFQLGQTLRRGESIDQISWNTEVTYIWNKEHNKILQRGFVSLITKDPKVSSLANGQSGYLTGQIELKDDKLLENRSYTLFEYLGTSSVTATQKCSYTRKK